MDLSLPCTGGENPPALADSETLDLDSVNTKSAQEPGTETVSSLADITDESRLHVSANPDSLESLLSIYSMSERFSLSPEASPKDDDVRAECCLGQSEAISPLSPHLSQNLPLPQSEYASSSAIQGNTPPESFGAVSPEGLMDLSVTVPFSSLSFSSENRPPSLRSLDRDTSDSDTAVAPLSDLYIFESDTQDFILSPGITSHEIKCPEYQPLSQTSGEQVNPDRDERVVMCDSSDVTECHHSSCEEQYTENNESDVSEHSRLRTPAADAWEAGFLSLNDVRRGKARVAGTTLQRSSSPVELWQDARQYLTGDDAEGQDVWDKMHHSVMQGDLSHTSDLPFSPRETQVSDYNPEGSEGIGWTGNDTKGWGPPVKRWSSVDSWATALSDWTDIIVAPPEDFTSAFSEIGAEIDALTQALSEVHTLTETETARQGRNLQSTTQAQMGVQDQPLKAQNISERQGSLSLCFESSGLKLHDREGAESLCDSTTPTQGAKCSPCTAPQHSSRGSPGATMASPPLMPGSTSADLNLSLFDDCAESLETERFISNEEDQVTLSIIEDTDLITEEVRRSIFKHL